MHSSQSQQISCRSDIQYHIIGCYCSRNTQKRIKGMEYRYTYLFFVSKSVVIYQFDESAIYTRHTKYFIHFFFSQHFLFQFYTILLYVFFDIFFIRERGVFVRQIFSFCLEKMTYNGYSTHDPAHQSSSEFLDDKYITGIIFIA